MATQSILLTFFNSLVDVLEENTNASIKATLGDSVNNNRTPSVSQIIRFLAGTNVNVQLSIELQAVYTSLLPILKQIRASHNFRQDAFDINELLTVFKEYILEGNPSIKRTFTNIVNNASAVIAA